MNEQENIDNPPKEPIMYLVADWDGPEYYPSLDKLKEKYTSPPEYGELYSDGTTRYYNYDELTYKGVFNKITPDPELVRQQAEEKVATTQEFLASLSSGTSFTGWVGHTSVDSAIHSLSRPEYKWAY